MLRRKSKMVVPNVPEVKNTILEWLHSSSQGGHSGRDVTVRRVKGLFHWKGMPKDIQNYLRSCGICQQYKYDTSAYPGLLYPLPIPEVVWIDISMHFIDSLLKYFGKTVILVVVDRLSRLYIS